MRAELLMPMGRAKDDAEIRRALMVPTETAVEGDRVAHAIGEFLRNRRSHIACCSRRRADFRVVSPMPARHSSCANGPDTPTLRIRGLIRGSAISLLGYCFAPQPPVHRRHGDDACDHPHRTWGWRPIARSWPPPPGTLNVNSVNIVPPSMNAAGQNKDLLGHKRVFRRCHSL